MDDGVGPCFFAKTLDFNPITLKYFRYGRHYLKC